MQTQTKLLTWEEFKEVEFEEDELKEFIFELLNGEIMKQNYPSLKHQRISRNLSTLLHTFVSENKLGEILYAPFGVILDENNAPQPDLIFVKAEKKGIIQNEGVFGVPDLLIEIISPGSIKNDRFDKYKVYESCGVAEYWLVDSKNESIEVYENTPEGYELFTFAVESGMIKSKVLEGLEIEIKSIFL